MQRLWAKCMWDLCGCVIDEALSAVRDQWKEFEAVVVRMECEGSWMVHSTAIVGSIGSLALLYSEAYRCQQWDHALAR